MNTRRGEPPSKDAPPRESSENVPLQDRPSPTRNLDEEPPRRYHGGQDDRSVQLNPEPDGFAPNRSVPAGDEDDVPGLRTSEGDADVDR